MLVTTPFSVGHGSLPRLAAKLLESVISASDSPSSFDVVETLTVGVVVVVSGVVVVVVAVLVLVVLFVFEVFFLVVLRLAS